MNRLARLAVLIVLGGCAHFRAMGDGTPDRYELWDRAHAALAAADFPTAEALFERITLEHPGTVEARESTFYLGSIRLDPRNREWDPVIAEERLGEYLAAMWDDGPRLFRYPEAVTLHEIARQLNLPPDARVEGLQPEQRVVTIQERVMVPADQSKDLAAEVEALRRQLAERDARIQAQQEELERIRRTLTTPTRP